MLSIGLGACSAFIPSKDARSGIGKAEGEDVVVHAKPYSGAPEEVLDGLADGVEVEAVFALHSHHTSFGGLSGLWVAPDGESLLAVSDIGQRWQARLQHDDTGRLTGLDGWSVADLVRRPEEGDGSKWLDAESLSSDGLGGLVVAYEGEHRLRRWMLDSLDAIPEHVRLPDGLGGPSNSGIEALSDLEGGRLFAVGERVGAWGGEGLMGWVIDETSADDLIYIPGPNLAPTGADRLEDRVYVVERGFSLFGGFRTRIVSVASEAVKPNARLEGTELAAFRWGDFGENFEGISLRRGPDGRALLYLLADDNFSFLQDTLLVQLSLPTSGPIN